MFEHRKAYETRLDAQLAQWDADIGVLKAKAARAEVDAKIRYDEALTGLQLKHDEVGIHLGKLRAASDETWEAVKAGAEKAWLEFKLLFHSATSSA